MCLKGMLGCFTFNESGKIMLSSLVKKGEIFKVKEDIYHVFLPLSSKTIFFETRAGPFYPKKKQLFPRWCPKTNTEMKKFKKYLHSQLNEKKN